MEAIYIEPSKASHFLYAAPLLILVCSAMLLLFHIFYIFFLYL